MDRDRSRHLKLKRLLISPDIIFEFCKTGQSFHCFNGLPKDSKFVNIAHDPLANCWAIFFEHESFMDVPLGGNVPSCEPPRFRKISDILKSSEMENFVFEKMGDELKKIINDTIEREIKK